MKFTILLFYGLISIHLYAMQDQVDKYQRNNEQNIISKELQDKLKLITTQYPHLQKIYDKNTQTNIPPIHFKLGIDEPAQVTLDEFDTKYVFTFYDRMQEEANSNDIVTFYQSMYLVTVEKDSEKIIAYQEKKLAKPYRFHIFCMPKEIDEI